MKFKLRISNALELANLYNAVSLVGTALGLRAHRTPTHRAHSEKIRVLRSFEGLDEDTRADVICAAITMRNALASLGSAHVEVETAEPTESSVTTSLADTLFKALLEQQHSSNLNAIDLGLKSHSDSFKRPLKSPLNNLNMRGQNCEV